MKIGFCCKMLNEKFDSPADLNQKSTTVTWAQKATDRALRTKLEELVQHNGRALWKQLNWLSTQPQELRLMRITSEFFPLYTHARVKDIYDESLIALANLSGVKTFAEKYNIRLGTHPGQFTTLSSQKENVVQSSIEDLEYHTLLAKKMGYTDGTFSINIHANVNLDPNLTRTKDNLNRLSPECQKMMTFENDEFCCGLDSLLQSNIGDYSRIVLDFHHHYIATEGEYISANDSRISQVIESWKGLTPLAHASISKEDLVLNYANTLPDFKAIGLSKSVMRAHSFGMTNSAYNLWLAQHLCWADIEIEAKGKNIASRQLYTALKTAGAI